MPTCCTWNNHTSLCSATTYADNVALPAFTRRTCRSRLIFHARRAHSSKPTAAAYGGWIGQTAIDGRTDTVTVRAMPTSVDAYSFSAQNTKLATSLFIAQNVSKNVNVCPFAVNIKVHLKCVLSRSTICSSCERYRTQRPIALRKLNWSAYT